MTMDCTNVREIAAELALGIADGEERARALEHLAGCGECRTLVERMSMVADELNLLAPSAEPPPGFETRTTEAMLPTPAPAAAAPRRRFTLLRPAFAALAAAALAAGAVWVALDDDREIADAYREVLAVANGEYFDAHSLELPGGERAGYVYGYQGRSSWVFAVLYDGVTQGTYRLEVVDGDGDTFTAGDVPVDTEGHGSAGAVIPIDYRDVTAIRLLDDMGREIADSRMD